jgi:hypothetical protein
MKTKINQWRLVILCFLSLVAFSCNDDKDTEKWVDLRYNPKDVYTLSATSPEDIVFEVSSTAEWEVFGTADWYSITPASGSPNAIEKVTIKASDNTGLDDRFDTVTIKSDYWTGKRFVINQKGNAYLRIEDKDTILTQDVVGQKTFSIKANQTWSGKVTQGSEWLSIIGNTTGSMDGQMTVEASINKGERRLAVVTLYDRHDLPASSIIFIQEGVTLDPAVTYARLSKQAQTYKLSVESNTDWKISKPDDVTWLSMEQTNYSQDGEVEISLMENTGPVVRSVVLTLTTVAEDDVEAVVKTVILKQAPTLAPARHQFNESGRTWGQWTALAPVYTAGDAIFTVPASESSACQGYIEKAPLGIYTFNVKETRMHPGDQSVVYLGILFASTGYEGYTFLINSNSMTEALAYQSPKLPGVAVNLDQEYIMTLSIARENDAYVVEWELNGEKFASYTDAKLQPTANELPTILIGFRNGDWYAGSAIPATENGCTFDWWEYSEPIDWGD